MKRIVNLALALLIAQIVSSQVPFKVITVNGEIVATKANVTLENGIEIYSDDNFDFRKPNSRAAMINAERGRVVLTEQNATDAFSKAAFAPAISSISSRAASATSMFDLKAMFSDKLLIIESLDLKVTPDEFPMKDQNFFFIRYKLEEETINKRLQFRSDTLIIDRKELFTIDGEYKENVDVKEMSIYYYRKNDGKTESILINSFEPVFVSVNHIKPEIDIIIQEFQGKPFVTILSEVFDYLNSFYGKVDRNYLESWLKKHYNIEG